MQNIFSNLDIQEEYDELYQEKNKKRARKKLKAIEKLKLKYPLNDEEKQKVDSEDHWKRVLNPLFEDEETKNKKKLLERVKAERVKSERMKAERMKAERVKAQQQWESRQKEKEKEFKQKEKEFKQKEKEFKQKEKEFKEIEGTCEKLMKQLNKEFMHLVEDKGIDNKKAKRILQIKYHPDKHPRNTTWATERCQIVNGL
jgi:hypothetical protein